VFTNQFVSVCSSKEKEFNNDFTLDHTKPGATCIHSPFLGTQIQR